MLTRPGIRARRNFRQPRAAASHGAVIPPTQLDGEQLVESEVAYLKLGELHLAAIPGELYPELVYGKFQDPVDPGADFLDAPLETPVMKILPGDKTMLIGLANDAVGYIVPKRQWDVAAPYAYGRNFGAVWRTQQPRTRYGPGDHRSTRRAGGGT